MPRQYATLDSTGNVPADQLANGIQVSHDATSAAADYVARIRLGTDTTYRAFLGLDASDNGVLEFGPGGAAARDIVIARTGTEALQIADAAGADLTSGLTVRGVVEAIRATAVGSALATRVVGDVNERFLVNAAGTLNWGDGASVPDVNLLRGNTGELRVDSGGAATTTVLRARGTTGQRSAISVDVDGDTVGRVVLWGDATLTGIEFGPGNAARDITLSRGAANRLDLATGDSLNLVSGALMVAATNVVGSRKTGYAAMTGSSNRGAVYDSATVTLVQLAARVKAISDDLTTHGLIGA